MRGIIFQMAVSGLVTGLVDVGQIPAIELALPSETLDYFGRHVLKKTLQNYILLKASEILSHAFIHATKNDIHT